jgi:hypothetical protein
MVFGHFCLNAQFLEFGSTAATSSGDIISYGAQRQLKAAFAPYLQRPLDRRWSGGWLALALRTPDLGDASCETN